MNNKKRPGFFLVGAPKSGTTSLYFYLKSHPQVFLPNLKELHYFSYPEVKDTYYQVEFISNMDSYLRLFSSMTNDVIAGDISPSYLYNQKAAQRIKAFNDKAKIIIILRDPVDRAISHFLMDMRIGYQNQPLTNFLHKTEENRQYHKEYIEMGMYHDLVKNYLNTFPKDQVLILFFEELKDAPQELFIKICKFLEIDQNHVPEHEKQYNKFAMPRINLIYFFRQNKFLNFIATHLPSFLKKILKKILLSNKNKPHLIEERKMLRNLFVEDIKKLSKMLDKDLSNWIKDE